MNLSVLSKLGKFLEEYASKKLVVFYIHMLVSYL